MELVAEDEANLAQKLFDAIFKEDSENRQMMCVVLRQMERNSLTVLNFPVVPVTSHTLLFLPVSKKALFKGEV